MGKADQRAGKGDADEGEREDERGSAVVPLVRYARSRQALARLRDDRLRLARLRDEIAVLLRRAR